MDIRVTSSLLLAHHLLVANLVVDLLKRLAWRNLRKKEGGEQSHEVGGGKDSEGLLEADAIVRVLSMRSIEEAEGAENGTTLSGGGGDTVSSSSDGSREDLGGVDEGGGVRTPVGEEESEAV